MVSLNGPVGVDIEQINSKIEKIAARFLLPEELEFIDPQARLNHLYACWSVKEAIYKWYGKGGLAFFGGIILEPFSPGPEGRVMARVLLEGHWKKMEAHYGSLKEIRSEGQTSELPLLIRNTYSG